MLLWRPVLFVIGILLLPLSIAMLLPAIANSMGGDPGWQYFAVSSGLTLFVAGALILTNRSDHFDLTIRQGFLLTTTSWIAISAFAALPLVLGPFDLTYTDAFFEAISGLTTTGSTVLVALDTLPPGILLWRGMLQWLGGIGIIVMAVAMLPFLRIGGMQLFRTESSDQSEKVLPRAGQIATATVVAYTVLSLLCAAAYYAEGMTGFEAVIHAMTTLSTGGYSTSDQSIGHFSSPFIHWTGTLFMLLGSLPFVLYIQMVRGNGSALWRNSQVRNFAAIVGTATLMMTALLWLRNGQPLFKSLTLAAFNVVSVITTTGYATSDYSQWGGYAEIVFFFLTFVGGCTGSTAGGLKVMRFEIMFKSVERQFSGLIYPHGIHPITYMGRSIEPDIRTSVVVFFTLFLVSVVVLTILLSLTGLDFITSASGAATAIANVGPGLGSTIGPAGNFKGLPDAAKWALSAGMLFGRLEIFTFLMLLTPQFWRS